MIYENSTKPVFKKCERIVTRDIPGFEYCTNRAVWMSPPGLFNKRVIPVCNKCKSEIIELYIQYKKPAHFAKI